MNRFETSFPQFNAGVRQEIGAALGAFLEAQGRGSDQQALEYLLFEVVGNSDKANLKRAYFGLSGLDIRDPRDYEKGMPGFREAIGSRQEVLAGFIRDHHSFLKVNFAVAGETMTLSVSNTCPLLPAEQERIRERLALAKKFQTIQEVLEEGLDQTEGGGFGLIISVLTLRKIGLDETALEYRSAPEGTEVVLRIPLVRVGPDQGLRIAAAVADQVDHIPQFPHHVVQILDILADPTRSFGHISAIIHQDPALIADLIKTANSSAYSLPRKVETIEEAVRIIGTAALRQLVMAAMAQKLLANTYNLAAVKKQMDHAAETAFYAQELAKAVKGTGPADNLFICAMLHDFGKVIVDALQPRLTEKIAKLCRDQGIGDFLAGSLTGGYDHALVGAALARKWNFPDPVVAAIEFHHNPLGAPEAPRPAVYLTYLANFLTHFSRDEVTFGDLEPSVLQALGLGDRTKTEALFRGLSARFSARERV